MWFFLGFFTAFCLLSLSLSEEKKKNKQIKEENELLYAMIIKLKIQEELRQQGTKQKNTSQSANQKREKTTGNIDAKQAVAYANQVWAQLQRIPNILNMKKSPGLERIVHRYLIQYDIPEHYHSAVQQLVQNHIANQS